MDKKYFKILDFNHPVLEENFRIKQNEINTVYNRFVFTIGLFGVTGFYLLFLLSGSPQNQFMFYGVLLLSFIVIGISVIISFYLLPYKVVQFIYCFTLLILNISTLFASTLFDTNESYLMYYGFLCLLFAGLGFLRVFFKYAILFTVILSIAFEFFMIFYSPFKDYSNLIVHYVYYCSVIVCLSANYNFEKKERHNFVKLQIIISDRMNRAGIEDIEEEKAEIKGELNEK